MSSSPAARPHLLERVGDAAVVQLYADGFAALTVREKILVWHLYLAALAGRDIYYDQRYAHGLEMRATLEVVLQSAAGVPGDLLDEIRRYAKLFWINTGPYHNLTARKFVLWLSPTQLSNVIHAVVEAGGRMPLRADETIGAFVSRMTPLFLDASVDPSVTNKAPGAGRDILASSANNLYVGVTMADVAGFAERYGVNSRLVKRAGRLDEEVYRVGGQYDAAIGQVVRHLTDAIAYAPPATASALEALVRVYQTGEAVDRERYDVAWLRDRDSTVDTINGFVEVYMDPRGTKGAWEALVYYVDRAKTAGIERLAAHAQWFEDRMPWEPRFRKPEVRGVSARVVEVIVETGDSGPVTPIGINLPNDQAIREAHGSKSVTLSNVSDAYERSTPEAMRSEFCWDADEAARAARWSAFSQELTTEMHEVIGHGSGRMAAEVTAPIHVLLKEHASALEESRADLVALYFLPEAKLVELGLLSASDHAEIVRAEYEHYARAALTQLRRVRDSVQLEEDHMRNRQMIVHWLRAHTTAIEVRHRAGKTYFVVVDIDAFRQGVARLLAEVQRIKGEGDYAAAAALFEAYGVHVDPVLRDEIVARVDALDLPSYTGLVMPRLTAVRGAEGEIVNVEISYPCDLEAQMLEYSAFTAATRTSERPGAVSLERV